MGTVSKGVPTPSAPLMKPPQTSAKKHQAMTEMSNSANRRIILEQDARSYQGDRDLEALELPGAF